MVPGGLPTCQFPCGQCHPSINHRGEIDPRFSQVPCLKNPRCGYVSRRNTEAGLFDRIVKALKT